MPRQVRRLFARLIDPGRLDAALHNTLRGKRGRPDAAWAWFRREAIVARLANTLSRGTWQPRGFQRLLLRDPKPRVIARAPIEDRIVHTAVAELLAPTFLRSAHDEDFACRPGFGTHRALLRLLELARRWNHVLHLDLRSDFASVNVDRLRAQVGARVRDPRFLQVLDRILDSGRGFYDAPIARRHAHMRADWPPPGRGLPMGACTSQLLACHVYLAPMDRLVKRQLRIPGYLRYVDDFFLFADRRSALLEARRALAEYGAAELDLRFKHIRPRLRSCRAGFDALGMRVERRGLAALPRSLRRLQGRARAFVDGQGDAARLARSMRASIAHQMFG